MRVPIVFLSCLVVTGSAFGQFGLGKLKKALDTGQQISEMNISDEDEIALGEAVSAKIRARFGVVQDEAATRYVTLVGLVLTQHSSRPDLPYRFMILDSNSINAFAGPGGFIHITRGALASLKDEAELAGVLGHEIGHVTERHTLQAIKKAKGLEIAQGQTLRGSAVVLDQLAGKVSEAVLAGFGRKEELESDQIGLKLTSAAGYDPLGLKRFLEVLQAVNEVSTSRSGLFASHPETKERLARIDKQLQKGDLQQSASLKLPERFDKFIQYEFVESVIEEAGTEGARGLASGGKKEQEKEEKEEKKKGGWLSKLKSPLGSGEKQERAEVTGTGAGRAVGAEGEEEVTGPKNPNPVVVNVTRADLQAFKQEAGLS